MKTTLFAIALAGLSVSCSQVESDSATQNFSSSDYSCTEVLDAYGADVEIRKLSFSPGMIWSTIDIDFSRQQDKGGLFYAKTIRINKTGATKLSADETRLTKKEKIGPAFEPRWGTTYHMYDFNKRTLELSYHARTEYTEDAPHRDETSVSQYFRAQCKSAN